MNEKIFISYKRTDKDKVFAIRDDIKQATGIESWIDLNGIESGDLFEQVIIKAIRNCDIVLFMMSKNSVAPYIDPETGEKDVEVLTWTAKEVKVARTLKKRVVPISIDGTQIVDSDWVLMELIGTDTIDYDNPEQRTKFLKNLKSWLLFDPTMAEIKKLLGDWKKLQSQAQDIYIQIKQKEVFIDNKNTDASREIEALLKGNDEEVKSLQSENATLKKDIQKVEDQLKTLQQEKEKQSVENKKLATENKALESQLETCNQEKIKSLDLIKNLQAQIENNKQQTYKPSFSGSKDKTITLLGQKVKFHKFENLWVGESNACGLLVNRRDLENVLDEIVTAFSKKYSGTIDIPTPDLLDSLYNSELRDKLSLNKRIWAKTQNNKKAMYWYLPSRNHYTTVTDTESARLNLVISEAET